MTEDHFVYFIQAGDGGHIKIGTSTNVPRRIAGMQTASPAALRVLAVVPGDRHREAAIHRALDAHRADGEWFRPHADVLAYVENEKAKAGNVQVLLPRLKRNMPGCSPLQDWRRAQGLTLHQLAKMCGDAAPSYLSMIENGKSRPGWEIMIRLNEVSHGAITPSHFLEMAKQFVEVAA